MALWVHGLITPNQLILCIETHIFQQRVITKPSSGQLQNNTVNGAMSITVNCVITILILTININLN